MINKCNVCNSKLELNITEYEYSMYEYYCKCGIINGYFAGFWVIVNSNSIFFGSYLHKLFFQIEFINDCSTFENCFESKLDLLKYGVGEQDKLLVEDIKMKDSEKQNITNYIKEENYNDLLFYLFDKYKDYFLFI